MSRMFVKPRVVISKCLEFDACRYNGAVIRFEPLRRMQKHIEFVPTCPEVEIGLGTPRDPVRLVEEDGRIAMWQPSTGRRLTRRMRSFSKAFLDDLEGIDGFILKSRSPSCGLRDVRFYPGPDEPMASGKGAGLFAAAVLERYGHLAVEDEGRLTNFEIRQHFFTKLYALSSFRRLRSRPSQGALVRWHAESKLLLMAYNQAALRSLGRTVANHERRPVDDVVRAYEEDLARALSRPVRRPSHVNALMHAFGYVSDRMTRQEVRFFLKCLDRFRAGSIPLGVPLELLRSHIVRFEEPYLLPQSYFEPYPEALVDVGDSGKGRDTSRTPSTGRGRR